MKANERALLAACIDTGIYAGWTRAHKHTDKPHELQIAEEIENAIWYEIDQYFVFDSERDLCDEVVEGFDELEEKRKWVGLTDEEIGTLTVFDGLHHVETPLLAGLIRVIEDNLKEKNSQ